MAGNFEPGSIADLVEAIPFLPASDVIPPLSVLNDVLATGQRDAGMSGGAQWEPIQLDAAERDELRDELVKRGHRLRQSDPVVIEALRHSDASYRDPRVKAVFAIAPALGSGLTEASLAQMPVPVAVVVGDRDATTPMATNAARIAALVPGADYAVLSDVTHYTFLNACSTRGLELLDLCRDFASVDRPAIHRGVGEMALAFFRRALDTGS